MLYSVLKFVHVLGVILLVGNVTITAFWKVFADRTGKPALVAHAQELVTITDWIFTLLGIVFILAGGYGMVVLGDLDPFGQRWLLWGQGLFLVSGIIWIGVLVPLQIQQARMAKSFEKGEAIPDGYWRHGRVWLVCGVAATVPLIAATFVMIAKP
jgi:uncharacterized membrane protein